MISQQISKHRRKKQKKKEDKNIEFAEKNNPYAFWGPSKIS